MDKTCRTCRKFERGEGFSHWCHCGEGGAATALHGIMSLCPDWESAKRRTCKTCAYHIWTIRDAKGGWCWHPLPNGHEARGINAETFEKGCERWEAKA